MTPHEKPSNPETPRDRPPSEATVTVGKFRQSFNRFQARFAQDSHFEDMKQQVRDLDDYQEPGDVTFTLESSWPKELDQERRDALVAAHKEFKGEPDETKKAIAKEMAVEAISANESEEDKNSAITTLENPSNKSAQQIDITLDYMENLIADESIVNPNSSRLEALRTTRDELHQAHRVKLDEETELMDQAKQRETDLKQHVRATEARSEIDTIFEAEPTVEDELKEALEQVPDDRRELIRFDNETFKGMSATEAEAKTPLLKAYMIKQARALIADQPEGVAYRGNVAGVMGNGGGAVMLAKYLTEGLHGRAFPDNEFLALPFKDVARGLGIDLSRNIPDFNKHFST